ncbi:MAG: mycofactocin-associated electron transfer flavoprotein beta subunit [Acidimicrobiales bacterium]
MTADLIVCLKWAPVRPEIDPLTGTVSTDDRFSGLSPADHAALEWGLRVASQQDLTVGVVTVGGPEADPGLVQALTVGAAQAVRIQPSRVSGQPSSPLVAAALAHVCESASLIFCGDHSLDRGSGSVPAFLAAKLVFGQALGCVGLELDGDLVAERRLDQGRRERLAITGKTVLSFEGGLELRRAPLSATLAVSNADISVLEMALPEPDRSVSVATTGPFRPRARVLPAPEGTTFNRIRELTGVGDERPASQQLELTPDEAADVVIDQLTTWGYRETSTET